MKIYRLIFSILLVSIIFIPVGAFGEHGAVSWWSFEDGEDRIVTDTISHVQDSLKGFWKHVPGIVGKAIRFDGYTTHIVRKANDVSQPENSFSIEGWIVIQSYPMDRCAIINQEVNQEKGYFLGIDDKGAVHFQVSVDGKWLDCASHETIPVLTWNHVASVFDTSGEMTVYINGTKSASIDIAGKPEFARSSDVYIGRNMSGRMQAKRSGFNKPEIFSFEGYMDELKIYNRALPGEEIKAMYDQSKPVTGAVMTMHKLPAMPKGKKRFGAYYSKLEYHEAWEEIRREGEFADVLVTFDDLPVHFVFWRGTSYIPCWVTANEIWYCNEFCETSGGGTMGAAEPMSDKQCRYSQVRIIENHVARVVIHWRYQLADVDYRVAHEDPLTEWGDCADEYYYIYPDGISVRKIVLWTTRPDVWHEYQETIIINQPGTSPEDNLERTALTLANLNGEYQNYEWTEDKQPDIGKEGFPSESCIEIINLKSKEKPFLAVDPAEASPRIFKGHAPNIVFNCWDHWPISQTKSWVHVAESFVRPSHTSLSWITNPRNPVPKDWKVFQKGPQSYTKLILHGMTTRTPESLAKLTKSWLSAPELTINSKEFVYEGYNPAEFTYELRCENPDASSLELKISGSRDIPVINPKIIIKQLEKTNIRLVCNGKILEQNKDFRIGFHETLEGTNAILFLKMEAENLVAVQLLIEQKSKNEVR